MLSTLFYFCFSALVVAGLVLWSKTLLGKQQTGSLLEMRESSGSPLGFVDVILMFAVWVVTQLASLLTAASILGVEPDNLIELSGDQRSWFSVIIALGQLVAAVVAMGIFYLRYRRLSAVGLEPSRSRADLRIGLLAFVMVIPAILILQWLLVQIFNYEHPTMEMLAKNANGLTVVAAWFSAVIVAPIFEELFFRGVLQAWLQRIGPGAADKIVFGGWDSQSKLVTPKPAPTATKSVTAGLPASSTNPFAPPRPVDSGFEPETTANFSRASSSYWPILATSLLFALAHLGQGPAPISLFFFGLALGYLFLRTSSIIPCIVLHMALNAFTMFWFTLGVISGETVAASAPGNIGTWLTF